MNNFQFRIVAISFKTLSNPFCRKNLGAPSISPFQSSFSFTETALKVFYPRPWPSTGSACLLFSL